MLHILDTIYMLLSAETKTY